MVRRVLTGENYFSAEIRSLGVLSPDDLPDIVGFFRTTRKAEEFLRSATKEHGLCPKVMGLEEGDGRCSHTELKLCRGACTRSESSCSYNERFMRILAPNGIKAWPFSGPILIEERNGSAEGEAFLVDRWCIAGSFKFDDTGAQSFLPVDYVFDYDNYRILAQFLLGPKRAARLRQISYPEFHSLLEKFKVA